jgi:hypothetical protein
MYEPQDLEQTRARVVLLLSHSLFERLGGEKKLNNGEIPYSTPVQCRWSFISLDESLNKNRSNQLLLVRRLKDFNQKCQMHASLGFLSTSLHHYLLQELCWLHISCLLRLLKFT